MLNGVHQLLVTMEEVTKRQWSKSPTLSTVESEEQADFPSLDFFFLLHQGKRKT
jgi:hypothetical protein